jgi:hypothetical protein
LELSCSPSMASVDPWPRRVRFDAEAQAAMYRERAAHLRTIADAETDPTFREQLIDLASQYDELADSAVPVRRILEAMRHEITSRHATEASETGKIGHASIG